MKKSLNWLFGKSPKNNFMDMSKENKNVIVPVKKILRMINECQTQSQIDDYQIIIQNYIKSAKKNNVENIDDLKERLEQELFQRQETLMLANIFNKGV